MKEASARCYPECETLSLPIGFRFFVGGQTQGLDSPGEGSDVRRWLCLKEPFRDHRVSPSGHRSLTPGEPPGTPPSFHLSCAALGTEPVAQRGCRDQTAGCAEGMAQEDAPETRVTFCFLPVSLFPSDDIPCAFQRMLEAWLCHKRVTISLSTCNEAPPALTCTHLIS